MKKEPEPQDLVSEIDFSGGVRGKYASRFGEMGEDLMRSAAALDRQAWVAGSLQAFQAFESRLVAYLALVFGKEADSAGKAVSAMLEALEERPLDVLWKDLRDHTSASEPFYEELLELLADRNWLVHRSFHDLGARGETSRGIDRLGSIAERSAQLSKELSSYLLERCVAKGMEPSEVEKRAEEVVGRWAAGRDAA